MSPSKDFGHGRNLFDSVNNGNPYCLAVLLLSCNSVV